MADDKLKTGPEPPGPDRPGDAPAKEAPPIQEPPVQETDAPGKTQEPAAPGTGPALQAEQSVIPGMGEDNPARSALGEVVVDFDKINELMSQRRAAAHGAVDKLKAPATDKDGKEAPIPEEKAPEAAEGKRASAEEKPEVCDPMPESVDFSVTSPVAGILTSISEMNDPVFSAGALGKGVAVIPERGEIVAPDDCEISVLYETGHAIGLRMKEDLELLIHIGINTVELQGKYFTKHVKDGDALKKGDRIVSFDIEGIRGAGYDPTVAVIVPNSDSYRAVARAESGLVNPDTEILYIQK